MKYHSSRTTAKLYGVAFVLYAVAVALAWCAPG